VTARSINTIEILELLTGHYEIAYREPKSGYMSLSFWLSKSCGNKQVSLDGLAVTAIKDGETRWLAIERLDTHVMPKRGHAEQPRLGMRLKLDALPEDWIGECEITFGRSFRCQPFKGIPDISGSLRPESIKPPAPAPSMEVAAQ
jgi:hypothetical protein